MLSGSHAQRNDTQRLLAVCGIMAPVLFITLVLILGSITTGYNPLTQFMSELGAPGAPYAIIQDINFVLFGVLIILFALRLHRGIGGGTGSKIGPVLMGLNGAFGGMQGIFPTDPSTAAIKTFSGNMHLLVGLLALIVALPVPLIISFRLKNDSRWRGYRTYSLISGVLLIASFFISFALLSPNSLFPWKGALQRLFVLPIAQWGEVMAIRLLRISS